MRFLTLVHICIFWLLLPFALKAQADIISVVPNAGVKGQTINVVIRGMNTNFRQGATSVSFGSGITVQNIRILDNFTLTANVKVENNASEGARTVDVITGTEKVTAESAFEVTEEGKDIRAILEVLPVQTIAVSDFDSKNIKSAPIVFTVSLFNDNQTHNLLAKLIISASKFGRLVQAEKVLPNVQPGSVTRFTNRDFDKYDVSKASRDFMDNVLQTGVLPPDDYTYQILIYDERNKLITMAEGANTITNPQSALNLLSPGVPFGEEPEIISNKFPQFHWFSQAQKFDIAIYKLDKNIVSPNDLTARYPVYKGVNLTTNTFSYPVSARLLEEGATYAWQVTAYTKESRGERKVESEVFWFTIGSQNADFSQVTKIEIEPSEMTMDAGDTLTLKVSAFNDREELVNAKPEWRVTPTEGGIVTPDGKFIAGKRPMTVAVVAKVGNMQEYATVKIMTQMSDWDFQLFFRKVFGLPAGK